MDALLVESFDRLLAGIGSPAAVREAESTHRAGGLWAQLEDSGFLDLMVGEEQGGAGMGLRDAFGLWLAIGRHALPVPVAQTMWLRAALSGSGRPAPRGMLTMAAHCDASSDGTLRCQGVPLGLLHEAVAVAVPLDGGALLLPLQAAERSATGVHGSLQAHVHWPARPREAPALPHGPSLLHAGALLTAVLMAGAMDKVLHTTLAYANDRVQFGRSIGKFQAVQQQLSVMAEQVFAARMAAEIGCAGDGIVPHPLRAAVAKARAGEAAEKVVAIAHAVHGAIGITAECELQLYTRRLQEWRNDFGAAPYWHARLGTALLRPDTGATLPFLLELLAAPHHLEASER